MNTVNASGGINGHLVQLITKDDTANPGTSTTEIQSLLTSHVDTMMDMSIVDQAWAPMVQAAFVSSSGKHDVDTPFGTNPDFYPRRRDSSVREPGIFGGAQGGGSDQFRGHLLRRTNKCAPIAWPSSK